jgi:hypothetical protein
MDLQKLRTLVVDQGLWLARLDQFGTKYEGMLPDANRVGLLAMFPAPSAEWLIKQYAYGVKRSYASCWHARDREPSPAVWQEFDKAGQGVAVGVQFDTLVGELEMVAPGVNAPPSGGRGPIHVGAVTYIDHHADRIPEENFLEAAFVVRSKWSYQQELRVLIHTHGGAYDGLYGKKGPFGDLVTAISGKESGTGATEFEGGHLGGRAIVLSVNARRLVRRIIPNPRMTLCSRAELAALAARSGMFCRVAWC